MSYAPVALFVYNRLWHTCQTVDALLANPEASETPLYVFSDAPRDAAGSNAVSEVRSVIRKIHGFKSLSIIERKTNLGLAGSIVDGVSYMCERYGHVVVLEDDLVTSPFFLKYMNEGLEKYRHDDRVISIHGYVYPTEEVLPEAFFLKGADCWGWATWKRGWELFESSGKRLLDELKRRKLTRQFDFDGSYPYTRMLQDQIAGKNDSWAIRWYASAFLKDKLTLYPGRSLVHNIGTDNSGTHCSETDSYGSHLSNTPINLSGINVEPSRKGREAFDLFFRQWQMGTLGRLMRKVRALTRGTR